MNSTETRAFVAWVLLPFLNEKAGKAFPDPSGFSLSGFGFLFYLSCLVRSAACRRPLVNMFIEKQGRNVKRLSFSIFAINGFAI
jgi:hypothetical protein